MSSALASIIPATLARPKYLEPIAEPGFGSTLTRITGDVGAVIPGLEPETWDMDARHHYSRDQPWNCDGSLAKMEQRGGSPGKFILDMKAGKALKGNTGNFRACTEVRWHPTQRTVMVGWNKNANDIVVFDALTDAVIKRVHVVPVGLGLMGEGSLSNDGSMVAIGSVLNEVVIVDIANGRVSPRQRVDFVRAPGHALGNISVSPLSTPAGGYVVAKASNTPEIVHVYKYGPDLKLVHHFESDIVAISHGDVGLTPSGREVFCGDARDWDGSSHPSSDSLGSVVAIDLETGAVTHVSAGRAQTGQKVASAQHCSCRGLAGWVLATHVGPQESTGLFSMELVAWKLDGSRECIRFGVTRTNESKTLDPLHYYRNEAHGVMSPLGDRVMFASNWQHAASAVGSASDVKSFVYTLGTITPPIDPPPPPVARRYVVDQAWTMQGGVVDTRSGRVVTATEGADLLNKWVKE